MVRQSHDQWVAGAAHPIHLQGNGDGIHALNGTAKNLDEHPAKLAGGGREVNTPNRVLLKVDGNILRSGFVSPEIRIKLIAAGAGGAQAPGHSHGYSVGGDQVSAADQFDAAENICVQCDGRDLFTVPYTFVVNISV